MTRKRWIHVAALALVFAFLFWAFSAPQPITFADLPDASVSITAAGFHCTSDRSDGQIQQGFLVTTDKSDWKVANNLCKIGNMGDEWKGKVWVTFTNANGELCLVPDDASPRFWGKVLAFGDADLLNQIEGTLRRTM